MEISAHASASSTVFMPMRARCAAAAAASAVIFPLMTAFQQAMMLIMMSEKIVIAKTTSINVKARYARLIFIESAPLLLQSHFAVVRIGPVHQRAHRRELVAVRINHPHVNLK